MKFRPSTGSTVSDDLSRFSTFLADPDTPIPLLDQVAHWLNLKLDQLHRVDAFGSEGQKDPRGDHRE